jgi:hypothetical protein
VVKGNLFIQVAAENVNIEDKLTYLSYLNTKKAIEVKNKNWIKSNEISLEIIDIVETQLIQPHIQKNTVLRLELVKYQILAYSSYLESSMKIYKDFGRRLCLRYIKKG